MTQLLQQALAELQRLSASEQDAIAALILEEIADERRRVPCFRGSGREPDTEENHRESMGTPETTCFRGDLAE